MTFLIITVSFSKNQFANDNKLLYLAMQIAFTFLILHLREGGGRASCFLIAYFLTLKGPMCTKYTF